MLGTLIVVTLSVGFTIVVISNLLEKSTPQLIEENRKILKEIETQHQREITNTKIAYKLAKLYKRITKW